MPEAITTPRSGTPTKAAEEMPAPDTSYKPGKTPEEPGPSTDDADLAPMPPSNSDPAMPSDLNDDTGIPSSDLDDLFPDEPSSTKGKPAKPKSGKSPDAMLRRPTMPNRLPSLRKKSRKAGVAVGVRRRSRRRRPNPKCSGVAANDFRPTMCGPPTIRTPTRIRRQPRDNNRQRPTSPRAASNPLRDARVAPASDPQWQSLAGSDTVPTTAFSTTSPAWHANPLRDRP